ncbi:MAG: hypothetical protein HYY25_00120 [Candidatus Wallbacteria bacterium]|nr:hypothetical protein [Candidatus Wallbacteria bacterium]
MKRVHIRGIGAALPNRVVPNETLSKLNGIEPAWIVERTGIERRTLSDSLEKSSTLATTAAREALEMAGLSNGDIDLLVLATSFPDSVLPQSTAGVVKDRLQLSRAVALDIGTPAIGFVMGLQLAHQYLGLSGFENALVIGAECFSSFSDLRDRRTCYLFGDGAAAMVLSRSKGFATISAPFLSSAGPASEVAPVADARGLEASYSLPLYHQPREKLQAGFERTLGELLQREGMEPAELKFVLPQQIHSAAIERAGRKLKLGRGVLFGELLHSANLLSATLPLSFYHLAAAHKLERGDRVVLIGTDGRYLWGGAAISMRARPAIGDRDLEGFTAGAAHVAGLMSSRQAEAERKFRAVSELPAVLTEEVRKAELFGASLSTVFFTLGHPARLSRSTMEQMGRETRLILSRQIRRRDLVVEVAPGRFAVILPNQDAADARRIAERLKGLLERLDPVEEIEIRALYDTLTYCPGGRADSYVGDVVKKLEARA